MTLLATKFFHPAPRPNDVARERLVGRLQRGLAAGRPLTLVSAPAGYGKTTLVAAWLAGSERPHAWLRLDPADDEPGRFLLHLVAALRCLEPDLAEALFVALQAGQLPPTEIVVPALINAVAAWPDPRILVLDDTQLLQHPVVLEILGALLQHQPPTLHLVLVTREDPPLPLTRARARDQLTEIRAADLCFTVDESARLLRERLGLSLGADAVARLTERTEGWAAGLQLAGLSLQGRDRPETLVDSLSGSQRFILGYLTEEVLGGLPIDLQDFLLHTSILEQLSPELCTAVTGRVDSAAVLERMLNANLFLVPLDDDGRWFRYHQLFAELLRHRLRRDRAGLEPELHRRASHWLAEHAQPHAAIDHALAAADYAHVIRLLETHGWVLLNRGEVRAMERWLQALPETWRDGSPRLALGFAWMHLLRGQFAPAQAYGARAQAAVERLGDAIEARPLRAECLALHANLLQAQGDLPASIAAAQAALAALVPGEDRLAGLAGLALGGAYRQSAPFDAARAALVRAADASRSSGDWVTWMLAIAHLTLMAIQHGRLRLAHEVAETTLEQVRVLGIAPPAITGAVHGALGLVAFELDQPDLARRREGTPHGLIAHVDRTPARHLQTAPDGQSDRPLECGPGRLAWLTWAGGRRATRLGCRSEPDRRHADPGRTGRDRSRSECGLRFHVLRMAGRSRSRFGRGLRNARLWPPLLCANAVARRALRDRRPGLLWALQSPKRLHGACRRCRDRGAAHVPVS